VSAEHTYDYAVIRIVPRVDRGECINAGVVLSCPSLDFLEASVVFDPHRVAALDPSADVEAIKGHLDAIVQVCRGGAAAGPVGELPQRARFHWLVSPRSTVIQMSAVHTGRTAEPAASLARLVDTLVRVPATGA
jgi:hypothetical protein